MIKQDRGHNPAMEMTIRPFEGNPREFIDSIGIGFADDHLQTASLDHSIWFHDRFRVDEWLLYALDSPATMGARALGRGNVFTADGRLVASVAQEGLVRMLATPRGHML